MNNYYVKAKRIFTTNAVLSEHYMLVKSGIIDSFPIHINFDYDVIDYSDYDLIPGLIDLHIHGRNGCDVIDANMDSMATISNSLAEHGVTGFLATTVTTDWHQTIKAMETIGQAYQTGLPGAQLLGGYSEGLFFSEIHKGAHNDSYFMPLNKSLVDEMISAADGALKVVALAPEKDNALEIVKYLTSKKIKVMLGHTDANFEQTQQALDHGACGGVHVFNGMRGIHHREPGCTGAVLMNRDAMVEVIADGVHLHPKILQLIYIPKPLEDTRFQQDEMRAKC